MGLLDDHDQPLPTEQDNILIPIINLDDVMRNE